MTEIENRFIWPKAFSDKAVVLSLIIIVLLNIFFPSYFTPIPLLILIVFTICLFFYQLHSYTKKWYWVSDRLFYKKLFYHSLFYRLLFLGIIYLLTFIYEPGNLPLELDAADAWVYHDAGSALAGNIFNGKFVSILPSYFRSEADWGFPIYLGLINTIFGNSIIIVKLINAILGGFTVVLLAKMAQILYSAKHARLTGIIAMLMPPLLWYSGMYLKETLMIFLITVSFYNIIRMIESRKPNLTSILITIFCSIFLFYFRTVLAVLVILSIFGYLLLNLFRRQKSSIILSLIFIVSICYLSLRVHQLEEVKRQYTQIGTIGESIVASKLEAAGHDVESRLSLRLIMYNVFFAPYPSFLNIDERQLLIISHAQNELVRNLVYYFALLGIFLLLKKDFRKSSLLLFFTSGYIIFLAISGTPILDRFHLPSVPFLIVFMAVGYLNSSAKWIKLWNVYLMAMAFVIIAWQLFKLNIRGML